jgi:hypothetical protein
MFETIRSVLVWIFAVGGGLVFFWYIWTAGQLSIATPNTPPVIIPNELIGFGTATGTILATNLGAVLGISIGDGTNRGFRQMQNTLAAPWAQLIAAVFYVACLVVALVFYAKTEYSATSAEILKTSLSTLLGVLVGSMAAVLSKKP